MKKIILILLVLVIGIGFYLFSKDRNPTPEPKVQILLNTSGWAEYRSELYEFTFKYPSEWNLSAFEKSPIPSQKRESFAFTTPKPVDTKILFSISLIPIAEWDGVKTNANFRQVGENNTHVYVASTPDAYSIPQLFTQQYETLLSSFKP